MGKYKIVICDELRWVAAYVDDVLQLHGDCINPYSVVKSNSDGYVLFEEHYVYVSGKFTKEDLFPENFNDIPTIAFNDPVSTMRYESEPSEETDTRRPLNECFYGFPRIEHDSDGGYYEMSFHQGPMEDGGLSDYLNSYEETELALTKYLTPAELNKLEIGAAENFHVYTSDTMVEAESVWLKIESCFIDNGCLHDSDLDFDDDY